jgi:ElaB/YqjD/DUF883 family membrane-anchored ribosome-binding protein
LHFPGDTQARHAGAARTSKITRNTMATTNDTMGNASSNLPRTAASGRATLGEQTHKVAEDVRELGNIALSGASDALHTVRERGAEVVEHARERGGELLEKGREKAVTARDGFETYVADNPFKAVLIAAGVGALIGYSLRNRN